MGEWVSAEWVTPAFRKYMVCIVCVEHHKLENGHIIWVVGGCCVYGGSLWVMGEWAVGQWIVSVTSFQKIYSLY